MMEFLQKNARAIVVALLVAGVITAISVAGSDSGDNAANEETVVSQEENQNEEQADSSEDGSNDQAQAEENSDDSDATDSDSSDDSQSETPRQEGVSEDEETYTITAESGDNQTVLVREILARHVESQDVELSAEQMLFTETNLVNELPRDDLLFVGDTIRLAKSTVEETIEAAQNLSEAQINAWAAYL